MTYLEILRDADDRSMSVNTFEENDPVQNVVRMLLQAKGDLPGPGAKLFDVTVFGFDDLVVRVWFIEEYEFTVFSFTKKDLDALCASS